jgi:hypothetical protein
MTDQDPVKEVLFKIEEVDGKRYIIHDHKIADELGAARDESFKDIGRVPYPSERPPHYDMNQHKTARELDAEEDVRRNGIPEKEADQIAKRN